MKTLSVTLIVKNEQDNLARLLPMLTFADEIIVVDTGSTDNTVNVAKQHTDKIYRFVWCDDFSKARNYAISKASCNYIMWLDADDIVTPSTQKLLMGWKNSSDSADTYYVKYRMDGDFSFWFWRERILRNCSKCRFKGFIHEAIVPFGEVRYIECEVLHSPSASHQWRNLAIYQNAITSGKRFSLRDKYYYARTLVECGKFDEALPILSKFAVNPRAYVGDRADAYLILANYALSSGLPSLARKYLSLSVALLPPSSETCCCFGKTYELEQNYFFAKQWYTYALHADMQIGFVNEYYKVFLPHVELSVCLWQLGDKYGAKQHHVIAKNICPTHPTVLANDKWFCS